MAGRERPGAGAKPVNALHQAIYRVVRQIPPGRIATYGQVAELAGIPRGGRAVGAAMRISTGQVRLPWQRVVGRRSRTAGKISILDPVGAALQRQLLEAEGIGFRESGSISLVEFGWLPVDL